MPTTRMTPRRSKPATTRRARRVSTPLAAEPDLDALLRTIAANLDGDLSLAALARRAGMSSSCFSRWFRERTGVTPHAYVVEARVERAKALLRSSDRPLLEIALAVGFSSQSCLSVTFRRRAGMTPADYRHKVSTKAKDGGEAGAQESSSRGRRRSIAS